MKPGIFVAVLTLNLSLGLRGFGVEGKDFFTMRPFSDPIVDCRIEALDAHGKEDERIAVLGPRYTMFSEDAFFGRMYLERLLMTARMQDIVSSPHLDGNHISVRCVSRNPPVLRYEVSLPECNPCISYLPD